MRLCDETLATCSIIGSYLNNNGIAWDDNDQYIGVSIATCCGTNRGIMLYDLQGNVKGELGTANGDSAGYGPYAGYWIAGSNSGSTFSITSWATSGTQINTSGGFSAYPSADTPTGVVVVK